MNPKLTLLLSLVVFFPLTAMMPTDRSDDRVDHGLYAQLLSKYVVNGWVNYQGFKAEEVVLDKYLKILEDTNTQTLSRNERFAFYINAYNAWTIKLILNGYPGVKSIRELGEWFKTPWKKKICRIDGQIMTLDHIEHEILRPEFKDPRVHFAVNCASKGCPPLRSEPYMGSVLDQQLDDSTSAFINDPAFTRVQGNVLFVSKIFQWFEKDFGSDIIGFVERYAEGDLKKQIKTKQKTMRVKYLDYDWSLNGE